MVNIIGPYQTIVNIECDHDDDDSSHPPTEGVDYYQYVMWTHSNDVANFCYCGSAMPGSVGFYMGIKKTGRLTVFIPSLSSPEFASLADLPSIFPDLGVSGGSGGGITFTPPGGASNSGEGGIGSSFDYSIDSGFGSSVPQSRIQIFVEDTVYQYWHETPTFWNAIINGPPWAFPTDDCSGPFKDILGPGVNIRYDYYTKNPL
jgi:hypothetical protein